MVLGLLFNAWVKKVYLLLSCKFIFWIMIQRIQSVYLAVAGLLGIVSLFLNLNSKTTDDGEIITPFTHGYLSCDESSNAYFGFLVIAAALLVLFTIFQFKKRKLQISLNRISIILLLIAFALHLYLYSSYGEGTNINFTISFPLIQIILIYFALRAIKKDEELIRSVDRIR